MTQEQKKEKSGKGKRIVLRMTNDEWAEMLEETRRDLHRSAEDTSDYSEEDLFECALPFENNGFVVEEEGE